MPKRTGWLAADAFLVIDDTALPKKGRHSVGVAPQYATVLGKNANCQTLVSVTLARREVPVMVGLRLFLPERRMGFLAVRSRAVDVLLLTAAGLALAVAASAVPGP